MKKQMRPSTAAKNNSASKQDVEFGQSMSSIGLSTSQRIAGNSLEGGKTGRSIYSTTSSVISMSKKQNNVQVYGSEAGLKSVTKNPWAKSDAPAGSLKPKGTISNPKITQEVKILEGGMKGHPSSNESQKLKEGKSTKSSQSGVLNIPKGRTSMKFNGSNISQSCPQPAKNGILFKGTIKDPEKQERLSGLKDQTSIFGAFQNLSLKYAEDSDEQDTNDELARITKISQLGKQLCSAQARKLKQEKELLMLNYEQFLSDDYLKEKDSLVNGLSDYLTKAQNLSDNFEDISSSRAEMGNYVRIPIEARATFFDVIKSQIKTHLPDNNNVIEDRDIIQNKQDQNDEGNDNNDFQVQRNKKKVNINIWGAAAPLFDIQNQIAFTEQAESLIEYMRNQITDLQDELESIKQTEEIL